MKFDVRLSELLDRDACVGLGTSGMEGSVGRAKEVQTRERDQIQTELAQVAIELAREPQARAGPAHHLRHQAVQIVECRAFGLERSCGDFISVARMRLD